MNTRTIIASLNQIANELDNNGLYYLSDKLTNTMVKISQKKPSFLETFYFRREYSIANNAAKAAGLKYDLDPEAFILFQKLDKDQYEKGNNKVQLTPEEIGRMMAKTPIDKNELKNLLNGTTNISQTSAPSSTSTSSGKSIFDKHPPLGSRVESGRTQNMTDDELIKDYVELTKRNFQIHKMDKVGYWEDHAKENLSPKAYEKFTKIEENFHDQYITWMQENPEAAKRINALKPQESEDNDPFEKKSPETIPGTTPGTSSTTSTTGESSGLNRWVNKAENIYKKWSDRNMPANSTAPALIKDVLDYMIKLKNNMPSDKASDAQAKIDKVQSFIDNIRDRKPHTGTVKPYSEMTGFGGKEADPFGRGKRLDQRQLDYLAQQESKSY